MIIELRKIRYALIDAEAQMEDALNKALVYKDENVQLRQQIALLQSEINKLKTKKNGKCSKDSKES